MILHIACFRWKEDVTEEQIQALTDALEVMAEKIDVIRSYKADTNLHLRPGGSDYGVAAILDSKEALDEYLDHPLHLEVYDKYLGTMFSHREAVQLDITEGSFR